MSASWLHTQYGSIENIRDQLQVLARYKRRIKGTNQFAEYIAHAGMESDERNGGRVFAICGPWVSKWEAQSYKWELQGPIRGQHDVTCVSCRELLSFTTADHTSS